MDWFSKNILAKTTFPVFFQGYFPQALPGPVSTHVLSALCPRNWSIGTVSVSPLLWLLNLVGFSQGELEEKEAQNSPFQITLVGYIFYTEVLFLAFSNGSLLLP